MRSLIYIAFVFALMACSKTDSRNQDLPNTNSLTPSNIDTKLDVVNIVVDPDSFIIFHGRFRQKIIVSSEIEYYKQGGLVFSKPGTIEIKGAVSQENKLKSIGISFFKDLENNSVILQESPIRSDHSFSRIKDVRLRNSGGDFYDSMLKDLAYTRFAQLYDLNFCWMYGQAVHLFFNEDYYGLLNLRSESNRKGLSRLYNADDKDMSLFKVDVDNGNIEFDDEDGRYYESHGKGASVAALELAISSENAQELSELIDVESFIDYCIFEDYIGNPDWPQNNLRMFALGEDKYQFVLYDLDQAGFQNKNPIIPEMEYENFDFSKIFRALKTLPGFEDQLKERQKELYAEFNYSQFETIVNELANNIENDMLYQISKYQVPGSQIEWMMNVEQVKRDFKMRDLKIRKKYKL